MLPDLSKSDFDIVGAVHFIKYRLLGHYIITLK